jgi:NAD(P)-dependent dehydrogenase (short-subunit alcohol dehydrogenase family)
VYRWPLVSAYSVSKAAVTKLTENLALETKAFGVRAFSVHPGLLPIGMSEQRPATLTDRHELRIWNWVDSQLAQGRGADPDSAVELLIRLAAGDADALSGRHLSVHDDLDALLDRIDDVRRRDLYVLHPVQ